ncbi:amidase [Pikeienuella piscinae]|uniref:Amidase n=1 Tax=Pikeienuella piscinae TaxID=2748098 RepID=A0A7L5BUM3_9RHOB|nr:amidase [Pikeienuella piscinae]QIE54107.1 amidase [Pikeienuella piscinae]
MADTPLWRLGAAETAARIAAGDISARDVIGTAVERMHAVNPKLNAVVADLSEEAMAAAQALDEKQARGESLGPLHGVPVTIKVNVDQKGWATTNGVPALAGNFAKEDAPVVANLKKAGAVVIGRTNTPEFSFRADTDNPLHGRTNNPWGDHVSPGGSSGGAGSSVMMGIGALAHGNDIGGSLRFPAAANGAATVKPGIGRVPAFNPSQRVERGMLAQAMSVQGLIARRADDVRTGMRALIAPDARDPWMVEAPFDGAPVEGPIKVAFTKETFEFDLHPDVEAALDAAAAALSDAGYEVVETEAPMVREIAHDGYRALMGEVEGLMGPDIRNYGSETIKAVFASYHELFPPFIGDELLRAMAKRTFYARAWSKFLEAYPLVLTPFLPAPFFRPNRDAEGVEGAREALGSAIWSYSMNYLALPAGNIPAHFNGVQPISVQIVGRRFREDLILDACEAVETRVGVMAERLWARES